MFWKKKNPSIDKKEKKFLLEELKTLRNKSALLMKEIEKLTKYIEALE